MFREPIGLFVPEPKAKLYIPKNSGLHEYVNNLLSEIGVSDGGEFIRVDESVGTLEIISARGEDVPQRVDDCLLRGEYPQSRKSPPAPVRQSFLPTAMRFARRSARNRLSL